MTNTRRICGLATALLLTAATAQAQGHSGGKGRGKDDGKGHGAPAREQRAEDGNMRVRGTDRDGRTIYTDGRRVPPGLAKKPGGMPPGQYKKRYGTADGASVLRDVFNRNGYTVVRTDNSGPSQYVYYRLRNGGVRRAIVSPGTTQLGFSNVPSALLREVLARLY